jgi:hypothetical protein
MMQNHPECQQKTQTSECGQMRGVRTGTGRSDLGDGEGDVLILPDICR